MSTDELRQRLIEIHAGRGKLKALCEKANVEYKNVWKFTSDAVKKIDLDIATKLIAELQRQSEKEDEAA
ncbi:hypothetical protein [Rheinheimera sp. 1928-s]|uniref:hypothetical protein n=1 Tax=Rheinheimera sp. 1928-s TaxID=3033803 RepID=UPI00260597F9|nr:hypothetical protein [Rheinheimera sp. 1928-s]MDF3127421.1 hypothetical protein [Rheinheimera sp. 1928-s]